MTPGKLKMAALRIWRPSTTCSFIRKLSSRSQVSSLTDNETDDGSNWVGPPHPVSNLRLIKFGSSANESPAQKELRQRRNAVQNWNQKFWEEHNASFEKLKADYVKSLSVNGRTEPPSADEMSIFYKNFLDNNRDTHARYNKEWYKKNIGLLYPAVKAVVERFFSKLKSYAKITGSH